MNPRNTTKAMRQGAQLHYETLEKPMDFCKVLNISNIYIYIYISDSKLLIFNKLYFVSETPQLFEYFIWKTDLRAAKLWNFRIENEKIAKIIH